MQRRTACDASDLRQAAVAQLVGDRLYVTTGTPTGIRPQTTTWSRKMTVTWDAGPAMPQFKAGALRRESALRVGDVVVMLGDGTHVTDY